MLPTPAIPGTPAFPGRGLKTRSRCVAPLRMLAAIAACALLAVTPAGAATRAILVGVSDYENFGPDLDLRGPGNDVAAFARLLAKRGVAAQDMTVLADAPARLPDGVEAQKPTRAAILAALDAAAQSAIPGDTVLFYFSGHGSRQPDRDGDEGGSPDEIFLPVDAGRWNGAAGAVENAITDDEFRTRAEAILKTGAAFAAVLDACHSATGFRDLAGASARARQVAPEALGVPQDAADALAAPRPPVTPDALSGDHAFLYSAGSNQRAMEYPLTPGAPSSEWFGDFTFHLLAGLEKHPGATWRQAFRLAADGMRAARAVSPQRPEAEGAMLDRPVFAGAQTPASALAPIIDGKLAAGLLLGVNDGAVVALFADAAGGETLGRVTVEKAEAAESSFSATDAAQVARARYGTVVVPGLPSTVTFSMPLRADAEKDENYRAIEESIRQIAIVLDSEAGYRFSETGYDIALVWHDGAFVLGDAGGSIDPAGQPASPRLNLDMRGDIAAQLDAALQRVAHAERLFRATASLSAPAAFALPGAGVDFTISAAQAGRGGDGKCESPPSGAPQAPLADGGSLNDCDVVTFTLRNNSASAQDVTVLYVDAAFGISTLWPKAGQSNRIPVAEQANARFRIVTRDATGRPVPTGEERILVLAAPVNANQPDRTVFAVQPQAGKTRGAPAGDWLSAALNPAFTTRSAFPFGQPPALQTIHHRIIVEP